MATRSTLVIEIPVDKIGIVHKYSNPRKFKYDTPEVTFDKRYAEVYHHWDGYPSGFGQELLDMIKGRKKEEAFDVILDVVSGGDMSSTDSPYHAWRGDDEPWDNVHPDMYDEIPPVSEEYQYLFTADGKLMVRDYSYHGTSKLTNFVSVEEAIKIENE